MDDLERLIARIRRPEPSKELDDRVKAVLAPPAGFRAHVRTRLVRGGIAACVAAVCFLAGRLSVSPATQPRPVTGTPSMAAPSFAKNTVSPATTTIVLGDEQLASLLIRPAAHEGMLGAGPFEVEIVSSP